MGGWLSALNEKLFNVKLEMVILGLENAGKSTFVNMLTEG